MDVFKANISVFPVFSFMLSAVFVYLFLKVFGKLFPLLLKRKSLKSKFNRSYGFVELMVWIIYIILIIPKFYRINFEYGIIISIILLAILLIIAWFAGRDIVAGFILRSNSGFMLNAEIKSGEFEGIVAEFYSRNFKLISENGDKVLIPYSQILGKPIRFFTQEKSRISKRIQLDIKTTMNFEKLKSLLKFQVMTNPNSLLNKVPIFSIVKHDKDGYIIDVLVYARNSQGLSDIEGQLKDYIISNTIINS